MPWLWLRGNVAGLVIAMAFGVVLDVAILATWIWADLFDLEITLGLWAAAAVVWIVGTVSALAAFPPLISTTHTAANDGIFIAARDAYLARDWLLAETKLRALLIVSPTDGEAQLLLATLLRRVGRNREARAALETLSRSESGAAWNSAIGRELIRLDAPEAAPDGDPEGFIVPLAATYNVTPAGEAAA